MKILFHKKYPSVADGQIETLIESMIRVGITEYTTSTYMLVDMLRLYLSEGKIDSLIVIDEETGYEIKFTENGTYPLDCIIPENFNVNMNILHQLLTVNSNKYKLKRENNGTSN